MYKIGDYIVYRKDVCKVVDIKKNHFNNLDYYILEPIDDSSLRLDVPVDNRCGYLRNLVSKDDIDNIINNIPNIEIINIRDKTIENIYKNLMTSGNHEDLIKIIKTTYLRNQERIDSNRKVSDRDTNYFNQAEKCLYNEFSIVLGMSYEDTKQYVIDRVLETNNCNF